MRIAIVGTGISGLVAAHHLRRRHDITVFEAADRIGGHTNTVDVEIADGRFSVDTGFIVCNERTYPHFLALLDELGVATQPSDMSFSVSDERSGIEYRATNVNSVFAQRRNLLRPGFQRMVVDILRFNRGLRRDLDAGRLDPDESLADHLASGRYSSQFVERFLVPFGASIWSADPTTFLEFPTATYARFMSNHGLLDLVGRPTWRTVVGGSSTYVRALTAPFSDRIRTSTPVHKLVRDRVAGEVEVVTDAGAERFDRVVVATHSDQALRLLGDPSEREQEILGAIRYQPNVATLHTDARMLPRNHRARASWNFHVADGGGERATLTYWMNLLQSLPTETPLLVTLNRSDEISPETVLYETEYDHPVYDAPAIRAQARRDEIQGVDGTYYAGAYWSYGFHEDGVRSGLDVVRAIEGRV
ncbi:NAD(P)/FAD-dependent oxidoreductase [Actinomarinicola tropica]|uniref:FAD-dependent oxidoreductase n=1 Tax=Actinomarinicola tropica TaxID=2789776 RepID=A0A5Q2RRX6_9ACTN|nr:FAD-dependent oxidoreductase [Actinomarinicola tropica]QGG95945.1 FAD-dependent oxidoreductase [Actinomarinicola tropica]